MKEFYMSIKEIDDGKRILAVISDRSPALGHKGQVTVLTLEVFDPPLKKAIPLAQAWFKKMQVERPWETRQ